MFPRKTPVYAHSLFYTKFYKPCANFPLLSTKTHNVGKFLRKSFNFLMKIQFKKWLFNFSWNGLAKELYIIYWPDILDDPGGRICWMIENFRNLTNFLNKFAKRKYAGYFRMEKFKTQWHNGRASFGAGQWPSIQCYKTVINYPKSEEKYKLSPQFSHLLHLSL